jgi:hypothetical protein
VRLEKVRLQRDGSSIISDGRIEIVDAIAQISQKKSASRRCENHRSLSALVE